MKLADFGIARLFGTTSLTTAGGVLGTADYMSPEQAEGRPVTARCDQYSLGGVMYALLAGRPPFRAKNLPQMLQLQRFANPEPVRRYAPDTPEQLERVIMQLLAKDPADRFPNTQVLARHLQAMVMALSRPAADDFALAGDQPDAIDTAADIHESLAIECDAGGSSARKTVATHGRRGWRRIAPATSQASQNAATLAAEESLSKRACAGAACDHTALADWYAGTTASGRPARFTTVEEEEALRRASNSDLGLLVAGAAGVVCRRIGERWWAWPCICRGHRRPTSFTFDRLPRVNSDDDASLVESGR